MCRFKASWHLVCEHFDFQPLSMCHLVKEEFARMGNPDADPSTTTDNGNNQFCMPCFPDKGIGASGNIVLWELVQPDQIGPVVAARLQLAGQDAMPKQQHYHHHQQQQQGMGGGQGGDFEQMSGHGNEGSNVSWLNMQPFPPQLQPQGQYQVHQLQPGVGSSSQPVGSSSQPVGYNQHASFWSPETTAPPIRGLCSHCTAAVENVQFIQATLPNWGLTEDEVMTERVWRFVEEAHHNARMLVHVWFEYVNSLHPGPSADGTIVRHYPAFRFDTEYMAEYTGPDLTVELMVDEINREILMRKMQRMIDENNEEVEAIRTRLRPSPSEWVFYEDFPHRFVSHFPDRDVFVDTELERDGIPFAPPMFRDVANGIGFRNKRYRINWIVEGDVRRRVENCLSSPTPASARLHEPSLLDAHIEETMDVEDDDDNDDHFTLTDSSSDDDDDDDDADGQVDYDYDELDRIHRGRASIISIDPMSTPGMTTDDDRSIPSSISTPGASGRTRKRRRTQSPPPPPPQDPWRVALHPRRLMEDENLGGMYLD